MLHLSARRNLALVSRRGIPQAEGDHVCGIKNEIEGSEQHLTVVQHGKISISLAWGVTMAALEKTSCPDPQNPVPAIPPPNLAHGVQATGLHLPPARSIRQARPVINDEHHAPALALLPASFGFTRARTVLDGPPTLPPATPHPPVLELQADRHPWPERNACWLILENER